MKIEEDDYEEELYNKVSETKREEKRDDHEEEMRNKVNGTQKGKNTRMTTRKKKQR